MMKKIRQRGFAQFIILLLLTFTAIYGYYTEQKKKNISPSVTSEKK